MQIRRYGQAAFAIRGAQSVFSDPFGSAVAGLAARGLRFDYPPIEGVEPDLLLITSARRRSSAPHGRGSSSRCTTARRPSASSTRPTPSSRPWARAWSAARRASSPLRAYSGPVTSRSSPCRRRRPG